MAAYAQFGYGYHPTANQLTDSPNGHAHSIGIGIGGVGGGGGGSGSVPSPLSGTNEASLSPSGGSTATGITTTGPLSPGAISQSSNNAGTTVAPTSATSTSAQSPLDNVGGSSDVASGGGGGGTGSGAGLEIGGRSGGGNDGMSCCENGRPIMTDPVSGQTVCSCQYDPTRLTLGSYSRMPTTGVGVGVSVGVYGGPYPSNEQNPYPSIGVDSSAFYSPLSNPYGMKDNSACSDMNAWTSAGLQPTTGYYSYDPTLAAYGYGPSYDLAARRKNATRESTATLKAWLNEHKKNPYPTKGEKIMLAIITKMTLTQVSTWFANARRRLKKENKMTWEPKNKTEDDDDGLMSDDEKDKDPIDGGATNTKMETFDQVIKDEHEKGGGHKEQLDLDQEPDLEPQNLIAMRGMGVVPPYGGAGGPPGYAPPPPPPHAYNHGYGPQPAYYQHPHHHPHSHHHQQQQQQQQQHQHHQQQQLHQQQPPHGGGGGGGYASQQEGGGGSEFAVQKNPLSRDCGIPVPASKPKIWSVADTVACKTPPPTAYLGQTYNYNNNNLQQHQLQHHHHQQQVAPLVAAAPPPPSLSMPPQVELSSPLSMMSSYAAASPYSRIPTVYTEATTTTISTTTSNSSSSNSIGPVGKLPISYAPPPPQLQQLQQQQQQQQQQQRVGFPEIQPDTPPQTPPNMKLSQQQQQQQQQQHLHNSSGNHNTNNNPITASALAAASMCYSNGGGGGAYAYNRNGS